jgi:hypothetical protein
MTRWKRAIGIFGLAVALSAHGCGDGTEPDVIGGTVSGKVSYSGTAQGALIVAAFLEWPTLWAPEMFIKIPSPSYPQVYQLKGLDPGDYYIFAFIDVAPVSPTIPGDEDIKSTPTDLTHVGDTEPGVADITLPAD